MLKWTCGFISIREEHIEGATWWRIIYFLCFPIIGYKITYKLY